MSKTHSRPTWVKGVQASGLESELLFFKCRIEYGVKPVRLFLVCMLTVGLAILLVVGLLRVVRDLFSGSLFAAPTPMNEEQRRKNGENAPLSRLPD